MQKKTLNVKRTNNLELAKNWNINYSPNLKGELFIRSNAKGKINWEKAPVYNLDELLKRGNTNVIKNN